MEKLITSYANVFSKGQHHIQLKLDTVPVKQQLRRISFAYQDEAKKDLKAMLENGVIEKSSSEWASPLVIVRKSSGDVRICVAGLQKT